MCNKEYFSRRQLQQHFSGLFGKRKAKNLDSLLGLYLSRYAEQIIGRNATTRISVQLNHQSAVIFSSPRRISTMPSVSSPQYSSRCWRTRRGSAAVTWPWVTGRDSRL